MIAPLLFLPFFRCRSSFLILSSQGLWLIVSLSSLLILYSSGFGPPGELLSFLALAFLPLPFFFTGNRVGFHDLVRLFTVSMPDYLFFRCSFFPGPQKKEKELDSYFDIHRLPISSSYFPIWCPFGGNPPKTTSCDFRRDCNISIPFSHRRRQDSRSLSNSPLLPSRCFGLLGWKLEIHVLLESISSQ